MADCVLEQLAKAVKTQLATLVDDDETLTAVERPVKYGLPSRPRNKLAVLQQGDPIEIDAPAGWKRWQIEFYIDLFLWASDSSTDPIDTAINNLRATVEKTLLTDPTFGGLALETAIRDPESFDAGEALEGVRVTAESQFQHLLADPFSQGGD